MAKKEAPPTQAAGMVSIADPEAIGQRIRLIRGALDQFEFADRIGVSKNSLGRYERNEGPPDAKFLQRLCLSYPEISPAWLLLGSGPQMNADLATQGTLNDQALVTAYVYMENQLSVSKLHLDATKRAQLLIDLYQLYLTSPSRLTPRIVTSLVRAHSSE